VREAVPAFGEEVTVQQQVVDGSGAALVHRAEVAVHCARQLLAEEAHEVDVVPLVGRLRAALRVVDEAVHGVHHDRDAARARGL
jgi:hypothetical protein